VFVWGLLIVVVAVLGYFWGFFGFWLFCLWFWLGGLVFFFFELVDVFGVVVVCGIVCWFFSGLLVAFQGFCFLISGFFLSFVSFVCFSVFFFCFVCFLCFFVFMAGFFGGFLLFLVFV